MTTPAQVRKLRMTAADRQELQAILYTTKRKVYVETLNRLADEHGYTGSKAIIALSRDVDRALRSEATEAAMQVTNTFNAAVVDWAKDLPVGISDADLRQAYADWLERRNAWHAPLVGTTESYNAYMDATIAFYRDLGIPEPMYDFLGHNGSHAASCVICQALVATNPHSAEEAAMIGSPHPGCVHGFVAREPDMENAPDRIVLGRTTGGVLGTKTLIEDFGNDKRKAADALVAGVRG